MAITLGMQTTGGMSAYGTPSGAPATGGSSISRENPVYLKSASPTLGTYLTDPSGMTLYIFSADGNGISNCTGECAVVWPPYTVPSGITTSNLPSNITVITRSDGGQQYVWKGHPLYTFTKDTLPGQTNGQGINRFGGIWTVAR